jgi:hypothetical protein
LIPLTCASAQRYAAEASAQRYGRIGTAVRFIGTAMPLHRHSGTRHAEIAFADKHLQRARRS